MAEEERDEPQRGGANAAQAAMQEITERELRIIRRRRRRRRTLLIGFFSLIGFAAVMAIVLTIQSNLDFSRNMIRSPEVRIMGFDGATLEIVQGRYSQDVSLTTIPERIQNVFVAGTDPGFYGHFGVSTSDFVRVFSSNDIPGSTITMRVARSFFKTPEVSAGRHLQELLVALWLEFKFNKKTILRSYLERSYMGRGIFGITAASRIWYGSPAERITLHQAAVLAAAMNDPKKFDPLYHPRDAANAANEILLNMGRYKYIELDRVSALTLVEPKLDVQYRDGVVSSYVVDMVMDEVASRIGYTSRDIEVTTSIDLTIQRLAQDVVREVSNLRLKPKGVEQAALLSMSPDGRIRAIVGGASYSPFRPNRALDVRHFPGRMIKIVPYYYAMNENSDPAQWVRDNRMAVGGWRPVNPDHEYRGQISLREAFVLDVNTVPVNLADQFGLLKVKEYAQAIGVKSPLSNDIRTVVGLDPVTLADIASIHALPQNSGKPVQLSLVNRVAFAGTGELVYQRVEQTVQKRLTDEAIQGAYTLFSSVTDPQLRLDRPFAGYGTQDSGASDAWFTGFTSDLITVVWAGNDDNSRIPQIRGDVELASLWRLFMLDAHDGLPIRSMIRAASQRRRESDGVADMWKNDLSNEKQ
ncbi:MULTISPECIES: transglycosylase domain-containing protein [Thalassospira]|uniref:peptidoglycan glycosyltransferase n=1 Tax=Thalassospira xiamenensis TaxID=220697 RepID=A0ABR5Y0V6_9PROT|nr:MULTISPECIES: transglycosylase domain-containing protein [Thalassospira]KZD01339.1 penicillin-binding protein [Thalassospira xiamenensis]KZD11386.1 penicillin-binding protein [Thalassospira xiamenensis]MAB31744.1 penicillin-binding protein [Thalassospira sp.]MAL27997.1 penicillin-binding protein [Thalassospira sp.]MBA06698.1 penicillin-binding protein [Thalassospira sp.]